MKNKTHARSSARSRHRLDAQLAQLEFAQLLRQAPEEERAYLFKHALTQATAYESLLHNRRSVLHRHVAQALERLYPNQLDQYAAVLAHHYAEAGDEAKTYEYATRAGDVAVRVYAQVEAIAHYSLALQAAKRIRVSDEQLIHLYTRRGRAYELASDYESALANYEELLTLAQARGARTLELEALMSCATLYAVGGRLMEWSKAETLSKQALILARALGNRSAEARIYWNLLLFHRFAPGGADQAVAYGEQSIAIARECGLQEQLALSLKDIPVAYMFTAQFRRALESGLEAEALWRQIENKPMLAETLAGLGLAFLYLGRLEQALNYGEEAFEINQAIGNHFGLIVTDWTRSLIYQEFGFITQFLTTMEAALQAAEQFGVGGLAWNLRVELGSSLGLLGEIGRGRALAQQALAQIQTEVRIPPAWRIWPMAILARLDVQEGNLDAATAALEGMPPSEARLGLLSPLANETIYHAHAELALAQGNDARVIRLMDDLLALLNENDFRLLVPSALHLKARALLGQGELEQARALLEHAQGEAEMLQAQYRLLPIVSTLSEVHTRRGDAVQAELYRAQAYTLVKSIAAQTPPEMRPAFMRLPHVRAVRPSKATDYSI